jgi:signal transduction histidine kinase/DNA-binding response OmpR family regulator
MGNAVRFRFLDWPLRLKMAVLLVVASVLPLSVAAVVDTIEARQGLIADAGTLLGARCDQLMREMDTFNRGYVRAVAGIARLPAVLDFYQPAANRVRFDAELAAVLDVQPQTDPNIRGIAILDPTGSVVAATDRQLIGVDLSHYQHVRRALHGDNVVSDVYMAGSEPTIAYLAPVVGRDGRPLGAAVAWVRAMALWQVARSSNELAGPGSFAELFDDQGIRIAHTYSWDIVFHPAGPLDPATVQALVAERRFGDRTRELLEDVRAFPEQFERARSSDPDRGVFRGIAPVNQKWSYGIARRFETVPWTVFYVLPEDSIKAEVTALTRRKATFAAGIIVAALLAGLLFAAVILKPIRSLAVATTSLAAGDLKARVEASRSDELGQLGVSFNTMAARIEELIRVREAQAADLEFQNRQIQEANRLKSEFLANMSHELRTPLNSIIGFADLLHDGEVGPLAGKQKDFLGNILASGRHLLRLINDVLDLAKVEAGRLEFRPEPIDPAVVLAEVVAILRTTSQSRKVAVDSLVDPRLGEVTLDPSRFKQVLYNYLSNALKFTPAGGRVTVRVRVESPELFRVEVEDTGVGIAAEDIPRLFVEFQQLDAGAAKKEGGTGLGLALTRRLVEAQGGSVGVTSKPGAGSVFHALLPRVSGRTSAPTDEPAAALRPGAATVLVIEDDPQDRAAIVHVLNTAGYAADTASTCAEAVAKCERRSYDALTLDLILPDGSGLDLLRRVRAGVNRDVKVMVITVVAERGAVAGLAVNDVLGKPCDAGALIGALERAGVTPKADNEVLVVDDDRGSLSLMAATLTRLGFQAACHFDAQRALEASRLRPPVAVVLDLLMPGMDGFQFLERFREIPACRSVPVIVWTVMDLSHQEHARLQASVQAIVPKGSGRGADLLGALQAFLPQASQTGG